MIAIIEASGNSSAAITVAREMCAKMLSARPAATSSMRLMATLNATFSSTAISPLGHRTDRNR